MVNIEKKEQETGKIGNFVKIDSPNWVNIIPITSQGQIVMIEQFRHGTDNLTIEIPGGLVDSGEDPIQAAIRECEEETAYISQEKPILLGISRPNPAFMNNYCHHYLWRNCEKNGKLSFDENENIKTMLFSQEQVQEMIIDGSINHSIVLNAFFYKYLAENGQNNFNS